MLEALAASRSRGEAGMNSECAVGSDKGHYVNYAPARSRPGPRCERTILPVQKAPAKGEVEAGALEAERAEAIPEVISRARRPTAPTAGRSRGRLCLRSGECCGARPA